MNLLNSGLSRDGVSDRKKGAQGALVVCLGETMAQLAPVPATSLLEAELLSLNFAGAESTVAMYLAHFGHRATWVSRLGNDPFGSRIASGLTDAGVDTSWVERDKERPTGVYFKDTSATGTTVHYYRAGSAASAMGPGFLGPDVLEQAALLHITGITPALSESCRLLTEEVFGTRERYRHKVSFDVNHRPKLWGGRDAAMELLALANRADIVFVGLDEAQTLWGTTTPAAVRELINRPAELVVKDGAIGVTVFEGQQETFEPAHRVDVVEPVGAGDSFAAGYLHERLIGGGASERLRTGHRLAAAVLQTTADYVEPEEIAHVPEH